MESIALFFRIVVAWVVSLITAFGGLFGMAPQTNAVNMMAHRGYSFMYPENTALAFEEAAKHGAAGVETDLRVTKDGVYVLNHNDSAVFEDGSELKIADSTYAELTAKPLKNLKTRDKVYLCSLNDFLAVMKKYDLEFYIEFKVACSRELITSVFGVVKEKYDITKCIFESPRFEDVALAKEVFPEMPVMFVISDKDTDYAQCFEKGISADINFRVISEEMVGEFHEHGLKVGAWTCDDPFTLAYSKSLGVDYIESNVFCK